MGFWFTIRELNYSANENILFNVKFFHLCFSPSVNKAYFPIAYKSFTNVFLSMLKHKDKAESKK